MKPVTVAALFAALAIASPTPPAFNWHAASGSWREVSKRGLEKRCTNAVTKAGCTTKLGPMPACAETGYDKCCESDWTDSGYMTCGGAGGATGDGLYPVNGGPVCISITPCS